METYDPRVSDSSPHRVTVSIESGVAEVRLDRPDKLNALDVAMFEAIVAAGHRLAADPSVRAVVLCGAGRAFCAGLDVSALAAMAGPGTSSPASRLGDRPSGRATNLAQEAVAVWGALAVPTIAAVQGVAFGGGLQLALGADLRVVAPDARLSVMEMRWGLVPDMTGTFLLPRLVGPERAKELTWTARIVTGDEAVAIGLAGAVSDQPRSAALEMARAIAASSPDAVRAAKALLDASGSATPREQYMRESEAMARLIGSPNQAEAVRAQLEARAPRFADPVPPAGPVPPAA